MKKFRISLILAIVFIVNISMSGQQKTKYPVELASVPIGLENCKSILPPLPSWNQQEQDLVTYLSQPQLSNYSDCFGDYLKCIKSNIYAVKTNYLIKRKINKKDTTKLQSNFVPSFKEFNREVGFSKISTALDSLTKKDVIKWTKKNLFTGIQLGFSGFLARPNEFANIAIPDDYIYSFEIRKKASESCLTCPENIFGRKEADLKKDENKESYAFNTQGMQYRLQWDFLRRDGDVYTQQRQYVRYTKIFERYGFWLEADHKSRKYESINLYGSNQEYMKTGLRILYRVNRNVNLTFGYNMRATPWAAYTDNFLNWYERTSWDTESGAQNVFYDFDNNGEWDNDELIGTYAEVLDPVLNEPYVTNEYNAKKRIWAYQGSPVIGIDLFSESEYYFFNIFANFYPYPKDLSVPARQFVYSGNDVELKSFGMEADWAPTENVFEYDGGIEAGLKLGKKFDLVLSGEISNYYGVKNYRPTFGLKYKL